ncbi:unnamed protein product [Hapterophycus canaliculatus]
MGPRKSYNYGTFIAPAGWCAEKVQGEGRDTENLYQGRSAPAFSAPQRSQQFRVLRQDDGTFGLRLTRDGTELVVSEVDDDVARARGLCEGNVVTHIDGEPLSGSLKAAARSMEEAGDSLSLQIKSGDSGDNSHAGPSFHRKPECRVVQHVVRQGDSVDKLAELYGIRADELRLWNRKYFPVGEPGYLCPGQVLTLRNTVALDQIGDGQKADDHQKVKFPSSRRRKSEGDGERKRMLYEVREGDSLKTICADLGLKEGEVRGLNRGVFPIGEAGVVLPGQMLTVFAEQHGSLISEEGGQSAEKEGEEGFMQSFVGRKTRRPSLSLGVRGAEVTG